MNTKNPNHFSSKRFRNICAGLLTLTVFTWLAVPAISAPVPAPSSLEVDVCIYTATPSGIVAAIAVKREGRSVVIVEPGRWVGGMLGAGLKPLQDCPNYAATGGLTHELIPKLGKGATPLENGNPRNLNPTAIREDFRELLKTHDIPVVFQHRVASCQKSDNRILTATFDYAPFDSLGCPVAEPEATDNLQVTAKMFIDASYEGDLMAAAGVSFRVGRESTEAFDEALAGVREPMEKAPIDPFVEPGNPESGLLPHVENDHGKPIGSADTYTQAYNYRYYTTSDPDLRIPLTPPDNYDPQEFELVGRYIEHLTSQPTSEVNLRKQMVGIFPGWKNSGEWNYQRSSLFSLAPLGISQRYAMGDYREKAEVWKAHQNYLRGLHHFMSTDPRVPESYRNEVAELGLDKRAHPGTEGWPHQLYIRVARRLNGRYTISAEDVYNRTEINDPIGLAQYGIDTYPSRRIWGRTNGKTWVGIEGKMFIGGSKGPTNIPYPIPYRAITPQKKEAENLLVPVCFSATHLGYASARMEPAFMICGESAGIAATQAIRENVAVQDITPSVFQKALLDAKQKIFWDPEVDKPTRSASPGQQFPYSKLLSECDRDNNQLVTEEEWNTGKAGWEWLFAKIDTNQDGVVNSVEYEAFQKYKATHSDWAVRIKN